VLDHCIGPLWECSESGIALFHEPQPIDPSSQGRIKLIPNIMTNSAKLKQLRDIPVSIKVASGSMLKSYLCG
jgi:hypothetical protein